MKTTTTVMIQPKHHSFIHLIDEQPQVHGRSANKENISNTNSGNRAGNLDTEFHGLEQFKRPWKFKCGICGKQETRQADLNVHHIKDHGIVHCNECTKSFNTPSSLNRHMYQCGELKHVCNHDNCREKFAFSSEFERH